MKSIYFNLKTLQFQDNKPQKSESYLKEANCKHLKGSKVLELITEDDEQLHLHNDEFCSVEDEKIAVNKFRNKNISFLEHVDFFTSKNTRIENPIINDFL